MWLQLAAAGFLLGRYVYHRLTDDTKREKKFRQEIQIPRTEEGIPIPLVFGRVRVRQPILAWNSEVKYVDVDGATGRYRVFALDMLFAVGIPMGAGVTRGNELAGPKLHSVWWGDYKLPTGGNYPTLGTGATIYRGQMVSRPLRFGGPGRGGGLRGCYHWFGGYTDQAFMAPYASQVGDEMGTWGATHIPGLANQMCIGFTRLTEDSSNPYFNTTRPDAGGSVESVPYPSSGFIFGESPNVNPVSVEVSSYGDRLDDVTHQHIFAMKNEGTDFGGDSDPIEVIYDLLTGDFGKLGLDPALIDTVSFLAASTTLKSEQHGYSRVIEDAREADDIIMEILEQIDAALDEDPSTGKIIIKLIRGDFNFASIQQIDKSNCERIAQFSAGGRSNLINKVKVQYTSRAREYATDSEQAQNAANALGEDGTVNEEVIQYPGVTNAVLAQALAVRELAAIGRPVMKMRAMVDRSVGLRLLRGQAVKVVWSMPDIAGIVFRVADVDRGTLEDGKIAVDLVQDSFYVYRAQAPQHPPGSTVGDVNISIGS